MFINSIEFKNGYKSKLKAKHLKHDKKLKRFLYFVNYTILLSKCLITYLKKQIKVTIFNLRLFLANNFDVYFFCVLA